MSRGGPVDDDPQLGKPYDVVADDVGDAAHIFEDVQRFPGPHRADELRLVTTRANSWNSRYRDVSVS